MHSSKTKQRSRKNQTTKERKKCSPTHKITINKIEKKVAEIETAPDPSKMFKAVIALNAKQYQNPTKLNFARSSGRTTLKT